MRKTRKRATGDYVIAVPSYKRSETLRDKTLATLEHLKIPAAKIHVFVANKEEYEKYKAILKPHTYGKIIVGVPGMAAIRNFITSYFPIGTSIMNIDDDVRGFLEWSATARRNERPLRDLDKVIRRGFSEARKTGFRLWGIYPVANGFFMRGGDPSTDLRYIIGAAWGIINPGPKVLKITIDDKEDYLRSILMYLADGGILRFPDVAPQTAYYTEQGGMQEERTKERVTASAKHLHSIFPELTTLNDTKKSGYLELRLKDKRANRVFGEQLVSKIRVTSLNGKL